MTRPFEKTVATVRRSALASRGSGLLFVGIMVSNAGNFGFHLVMSRMLAPSSYGALAALLGITLVLSVPFNSVQLAVTRRVAGLGDEGVGNVGLLLGRSTAAGMAGFLVVSAVSPWGARFLHLDSAWTLILLATILVPSLPELAAKGVLLGEFRFAPVAFAQVAGTAVRVALGVVFVRAGMGIDGAIAATVLGEVAVCLITLAAVVRDDRRDEGARPVSIRIREVSTAIAAFAGLWLCITIDTVLARHYLAPAASGFYGVAATAARATLFLPAAVALVAFPRFAAVHDTEAQAQRVLLHALFAVAALSLGAAAVIAAMPRLFISVMFGKSYEASTVVVGVLAAASACVALINVLMQYHLARRSIAAFTPWFGVAMILVGFTVVPHGLLAFGLVVLVSAVTVTLLMAQAALGFRPSDEEEESMLTPLWLPDVIPVDLTIVVPFYNPGPRFGENMGRLLDVLGQTGLSFEIIAVSDGSTDGSEHALDAFDPDIVRSVALRRNHGKGQALRVGLSQGRGNYVGFIDADGDLDPAALLPFTSIIKVYAPDIILGSKRHPLSDVQYPALRRLYSWGYHQLVRVLFRLNVADTQTGLKLVRREVAAAVLPRMLEKRFAFDLELFVVARRLGYKRFFEAPIRLEHQFTSTISPRAVFGMLLDTLAIFYRLRLVGFYDEEPSAVVRPDAPQEPDRQELAVVQR
jgi:O-antigen/teichoic acid export membrane protein